MIKIKRVYESNSKNDGVRILVDRLWPRGLSKDKLKLDLWAKDVAPSGKLRKWFGHDPKKWEEFKARYLKELKLKPEAVLEIKKIAGRKITLLYSAHDKDHNNARVLKEFLETK
ncbi:MAG: DUF488 domain-containing protein [Acidobacteriaceae bacterium]